MTVSSILTWPIKRLLSCFAGVLVLTLQPCPWIQLWIMIKIYIRYYWKYYTHSFGLLVLLIFCVLATCYVAGVWAVTLEEDGVKVTWFVLLCGGYAFCECRLNSWFRYFCAHIIVALWGASLAHCPLRDGSSSRSTLDLVRFAVAHLLKHRTDTSHHYSSVLLDSNSARAVAASFSEVTPKTVAASPSRSSLVDSFADADAEIDEVDDGSADFPFVCTGIHNVNKRLASTLLTTVRNIGELEQESDSTIGGTFSDLTARTRVLAEKLHFSTQESCNNYVASTVGQAEIADSLISLASSAKDMQSIGVFSLCAVKSFFCIPVLLSVAQQIMMK